ncbi:uncharacterized protein E0L32_005489 [Thyridium curvatum]|uniref:Uncharacterized protein n=1 Tax=Thyridium curvatum TaxID=1093900 RepID=A0A507B355_9PEZI|nr:uncharacterized protein E0L32_005489 [Thyridium curvatum]TPX14293.1 hypothetical protein E0L32_005489 [Thyridium curvatum]
MALPRFLPCTLGLLAVLATIAVLALHVVLAQVVTDSTAAVKITAIASSILEGLVLVTLGWMSVSCLKSVKMSSSVRSTGLWFGLGLTLCTIAAILCVATLVCLSKAPSEILPETIFGTQATAYLVGSSVALGLALAAQLVFLVVYFVLGRVHDAGAQPFRGEKPGQRSPPAHVKSIRYSQTSPLGHLTRESMSQESRSPPGSSGGRSASETMSSIRSSLSNVVRPISSKTRLLPASQRSSRSLRSSRRPTSFESTVNRDRSSTDDGFDSWDTSAVDPQNRQTVLDTSSPTPGRFLETIPASPTTSRSPSPGTPLDLEPPRARRRSRSYSPSMPSPRTQGSEFTQQMSASESHIHPLFRSDSPTPPPNATPGTMVTAAPNAGQVITHRHSTRTLHRMRSGSLPAVSSPLSRKGSLDDFGRRTAERETPTPELREEAEEEEEEQKQESERKMTPPIPDWILSAGSRTSLSGYHSRKLRVEGEKELDRL